MNSILTASNAARSGSGLQPGVYSDHMLAESLSLHSETLALLRANYFGGENNTGFFADQINQQEASAASRRTQPDSYAA